MATLIDFKSGRTKRQEDLDMANEAAADIAKVVANYSALLKASKVPWYIRIKLVALFQTNMLTM